jgi:hypothetical protein
MPPELGLEDYATSFAPGGLALSTLYLCALRGSVRWGCGTPNPTTGLIESGWHWGDGDDGTLTFQSTTGAGVVDKTVTMPNRTLTLVGRAGSGTQNTLAKFDANGDVANSTLTDDGASVTTTTKLAQKFGTSFSFTFAGTPATSNKTHTLPNVTGSVCVAASPTDNTIIQFNGTTGEVENSPISNPSGELIIADGIGSGGMCIYSPSVGATMLGWYHSKTDNVMPGWKGSDTLLEAKVVDDSAYANVKALSFIATESMTTGSAFFGKTSQTATNGGNYSVAYSVHTVFVNASGLSSTNNYDVTLPSAVSYEGRRIEVKITTVGTGSATVTVKSAAGTVEGVAAGTGVAMDATARSRVVYQSDGTNWWDMT